MLAWGVSSCRVHYVKKPLSLKSCPIKLATIGELSIRLLSNDCTLLFETLGVVYPSDCMAPVFITITKLWLCPRALRSQSHPEPSDSIERAHLRTVRAWVLRSCTASECRAVRRCASTGSRVVPSELSKAGVDCQ